MIHNLFKHEETPVRLHKREDCPMVDNLTLFTGCLIVASSALLLTIILSGGVGL